MYRLCLESPEIAQMLWFGELIYQKPRIGSFGENHENMQVLDIWEVIEISEEANQQ